MAHTTNNLRKLRNSSKCRLWELAARAGVSAATLSAIERYGYTPRSDTKQRIAQALDVPVVDLWPIEEINGKSGERL